MPSILFSRRVKRHTWNLDVMLTFWKYRSKAAFGWRRHTILQVNRFENVGLAFSPNLKTSWASDSASHEAIDRLFIYNAAPAQQSSRPRTFDTQPSLPTDFGRQALN